ncbi:MAG: hypothetical protein AB7C98_09160 [Acidithiobacillus sp.]
MDAGLLKNSLLPAQAPLVFAGKHFTREDDRKDYGEVRLITAGVLRERMVVMGKTSNV